MRERGIIFNAEMVRAILDGRKTQTRRVVIVQPESPAFGLRYITETKLPADIGKYFWSESNAIGNRARSKLFLCPFGKPGDRLWVRETFTGHYLGDDQIQDIKDGRDKADDLCEYRADYPDGHQASDGWTPSIHMPRWASRITLEITAIRVERLQDISAADADAEGIERYNDDGVVYYGPFNNGDCRPEVAFRGLWQSIYGEESWQANPWVWVIEFKRVEQQP